MTDSERRMRRACGPIVLLAAMVFVVTAAAADPNEASKVVRRPQPRPVVDAHTIVQLVFGLNPEVVSARYAMEAAEFQFKDFQRNLSQFTPFVLRSEILRDDRRPIEWHNYRAAVGAEKDFFDGSSIFTGVGHRGEFGDNDQGNSQFIETQVTFPLAGSNTTLRRITDRSREENEMFNSRLDYIDTVRDAIQEAQIAYFWMLVALERKSLMVESLDVYEELLKSERVEASAAERQHIEGEIQSLQYEVLRVDENINNRLLDVQLAIGLDDLAPRGLRGLRGPAVGTLLEGAALENEQGADTPRSDRPEHDVESSRDGRQGRDEPRARGPRAT